MGYAKSSHQTIFKANGGQEVFYSEVRKAGGQAVYGGQSPQISYFRAKHRYQLAFLTSELPVF